MQPKNYNGWQDLQTLQSKEILSDLLEAKKSPMALMLIAPTGLGKTNTIRLFTQAKPKNTILVTIGDTHNLINVLHEIMEQLHLELFHGKNAKHICVRDITTRLNEIAEEGDVPTLIFDECENAKLNVLKAVKQIYDHVFKTTSIILIGTSQLIAVLNRKSEFQSIPQLKRRFKAGTRQISLINKARDFKAFFDLYIPNEPDVQDLLLEHCENYGELHDYLHPLLMHCAKKNEPISEKIFRFYHKLPKQSLKRA